MQTRPPLTTLNLMLDAIRLLRPLVTKIERHDRDLGKQLRRAASSAALNLAEATGSDPGTARARLHTALGSVRETRAALQVATAWAYLDPTEASTADDELDHVAAATYRMIRR